MIRSAYETYMVFGTDPNVRYRVRWSFADEDALDLGVYTPFVSRNWDLHDAWPDLGEVQWADRPWRNGQALEPLPGTRRCGPIQIWHSGYDGPIPPAMPVDGLGVPLCCGGTMPYAPVGPGQLLAEAIGAPRSRHNLLAMAFAPPPPILPMPGTTRMLAGPDVISPSRRAGLSQILAGRAFAFAMLNPRIEELDMVTATTQGTTAWVDTSGGSPPPSGAAWIPFPPTVYPPNLGYSPINLLFGSLPWEEGM